MAYRWKPKYAEVDPDNPVAWATCDRCGRINNINKLTWQYDYRGTSQLQNLRILVCAPCYDVPNPQFQPYILPPDPPPIFNARPENYTLDETSWLTDTDGSILDNGDDVDVIVSNPNPASSPPPAILASSLLYSGGSVGTLYLDLFSGNPQAGGASVLAALTGSATRTNVGSSLETSAGIAQNTSALVVTSSAVGTPTVNYIAFYNAATGGNLLLTGTVSLSGALNVGVPVQFNALGLSINLN